MNRYFFSFIITVFVYSTIIASFLYYFHTPKIVEIKTKKSIESVKFRVINQEKIEPKSIIEPKVITPPIPIKKPKPTIKPKPIIKKDINTTIEKPKPIIKPKPIKKIKPKKKKKITKKVTKKRVKKTHIKTNKSSSKKGVTSSRVNPKKKAQQKRYYNKISRAINRNKSYPSKALRREIEGSIKVKVTLSSQGRLISYKILSGKKIFKKSVAKAIKKSFPLRPPKGIFSSNIEFSFTLRYSIVE